MVGIRCPLSRLFRNSGQPPHGLSSVSTVLDQNFWSRIVPALLEHFREEIATGCAKFREARGQGAHPIQPECQEASVCMCRTFNVLHIQCPAQCPAGMIPAPRRRSRTPTSGTEDSPPARMAVPWNFKFHGRKQASCCRHTSGRIPRLGLSLRQSETEGLGVLHYSTVQ